MKCLDSLSEAKVTTKVIMCIFIVIYLDPNTVVSGTCTVNNAKHYAHEGITVKSGNDS